MALVLKDRVLETSTSTGTGAFALGGAQTGFQSFSVIGSGNTTYYTIQGKNADGTLTGEWEVGTGTYTTGSLARDTVLESSNANSLVVFSSGAKDVFCDLPAEKVLAPSGTSSQLLANDGSGGLSNVTIGSNLTYSAGTLSATGGGGMTYPGAGIANSTGSAWGTSYTTTGTGTVLALDSSPVFATDITVNSATVGKGAANVDNLALGNGALSNASTTGINNVGVGKGTLKFLTSGTTNIAVGYNALGSLTTGIGNIGIGYAALANNVTGSSNVAIGNVFTGGGSLSNSIGIGDGLGGIYSQTTGVGSSIAQIGSATDSVFFGYGASSVSGAVDQSVVIGSQSFGASSGTASQAIMIGYQAAGGTSSGVFGTGSIAIGYQASYTSNTAIQTAIGYQACWSATNRGNGCTAIGYQALYTNGVGTASATLSAANTVVGYKSLYANTTGRFNTALGHQAGWGAAGTNANTTGANNTYIGYQTIGSASTNSNETVIGASAVGSGSNSVTLGNTSVSLTQLRGVIYATNYTVATLPTATVGAKAFVTDALTPQTGSAVVGGGAIATPVYYDGTSWICDSGLNGTASLNINGTVGATTPNTGAFTYISTNSSTSTTPTLSFNASNSPYAAGATISGSYLQHMLQNKSATAGASTNYVLSNDSGTDSTFYGEFGMNSSVFSASTPIDFFSINNGVYFSGHDGDITVGSGNGFKTYLAWGTTGQSAHVINASGAIGLNTNLGTTPALSGTTNFGTAGQVLQSAGSAATPTWSSALNNVSVGATTASTGAFTTLGASSTVTLSPASANVAISPTGTGTVTISPAGALTVNPTAASTINNCSIGVTTPLAGSFTSLTATSVGTAGVLAKTGGKTAVTAVTGTLTLTTGGTTLATQSMATGSVWRVVAYGTYAAASSANARTLTMACFWGSTQLTAITTGNVLASTVQTTPWKVEFEITGSSATAAWVTGFLSAQVTSATIPLNYAATAASTTGLTTASTLDFRVAQTGTATSTDTINVQQVTIERIA